jgi:hypothetical protein
MLGVAVIMFIWSLCWESFVIIAVMETDNEEYDNAGGEGIAEGYALTHLTLCRPDIGNLIQSVHLNHCNDMLLS